VGGAGVAGCLISAGLGAAVPVVGVIKAVAATEANSQEALNPEMQCPQVA